MSNTQFLVALGICISLSSTLAAAEDTATTTQTSGNTAVSNDNYAQSSVESPDKPDSNDNNSQVSNSTEESSSSTKPKTTLIERSVNTIGEIGNRSIEQVSALGSKIAVNANAAQPDSVKDPFENFNRKIYSFNMKLDQYVLLPVARTYKKIVPTPMRHGVTNFFINLGMPWTAVNNLLQGHPGTSVESLSRFVINTATTLGFYDTATYLGIERSDEDFGLTLGKWGIGSGPYVMLPFLGPSTVRDTFSRAVDQFGVPQNYLNNSWESVGITGLKFVDVRARLIGFETFVQGDQYTLLRDVYLQKRQFANSSPTAPQAGESPDGFNNSDFGDNSFGDNSFGDDDTSAPKIQSSDTSAAPTEQISPDSSATAKANGTVENPETSVNLSTSAVTPTPSAHL